MKPVHDLEPVHLCARAIHRIESGEGLQVTVIGGCVWITQARDVRDVVLAHGQSFVLDRRGRALVYALKDAAIVVGPAGHIAIAPQVAAPAIRHAA